MEKIKTKFNVGVPYKSWSLKRVPFWFVEVKREAMARAEARDKVKNDISETTEKKHVEERQQHSETSNSDNKPFQEWCDGFLEV